MMKIGAFLIAFLIFAPLALSQNLQISGNGQVIAGDGSNVPQTSDGTDFSVVKMTTSKAFNFDLTNLESDRPDLVIRRVVVNSDHFTVNYRRNLRIPAGGSRSIEVEFQPISGGTHEATISILARRGQSTAMYYINVTGYGGADIMMSQIYQNSSQEVIEVTNLTGQPIDPGTYFLGIFERRRDIRRGPSNSEEIGALAPFETKVIRPSSGFAGNEVIVLSTSDSRDCYIDRVDEVGVHGIDWGSSRSLTKSACASETAHLEFDPDDWMELSLERVEHSDPRQNIHLGRHDPDVLVWDGTSWSENGLPDLTRTVRIEGNYSGNTGNLEACHLEVEATMDFDRGSVNSIVLYGNLSVTGDLTIGDMESLVMYDDLAQIEGQVTKIERSTYRNNQHDFTYWTSPVLNAQVGDVFTGVTPSRIFLYDQSQSQASDPNDPSFWSTWLYANGSMTQGLGYAAEGRTGTTGVHEISFTGEPNNGRIETSVHHWNDADPDNDWNMIGNPYPSAIDIEKFFDANSSVIEPVIYLWTHNTPISNGDSGDYSFDDYATYNYTGGTGIGEGAGDGPIPDKNIGSSQGFFIRSVASGTVVFDNSMRLEDSNDQFFKSSSKKIRSWNDNEWTDPSLEKDRIWLNLSNDQRGFSQILLGFFDSTGPDVDTGYDALRREGGNPVSFYSMIEEDKYVIQAREELSDQTEVPLGFSSKTGPRNFTIQIAKSEGKLRDCDVFLHDRKLQKVHELSNSPYTFSVDGPTEENERFSLEFVPLQEPDINFEEPPVEELTRKLAISNDSDLFQVRSSETVQRIRIFNILGALVYEGTPLSREFEFKVNGSKKGSVLLVNAEYENARIETKKIVHQ